jgi:uncharacterized membrane protein YccC
MVLLGCASAALVAVWILFQLYAPQRRHVAVRPPRSLAQVIVEPAFAASRRPPLPPRARMARGTGAAISSRASRADSTEKISRPQIAVR